MAGVGRGRQQRIENGPNGLDREAAGKVAKAAENARNARVAKAAKVATFFFFI
jgi:hypothetical protein